MYLPIQYPNKPHAEKYIEMYGKKREEIKLGK